MGAGDSSRGFSTSTLAQDLPGLGPGRRAWVALPVTSHTGSHPGEKPSGGWGSSHLHPGHVDAGPHLEVGAHLDDPGHTVEQHIVELQETQA